jgi:hypothetical protein
MMAMPDQSGRIEKLRAELQTIEANAAQYRGETNGNVAGPLMPGVPSYGGATLQVLANELWGTLQSCARTLDDIEGHPQDMKVSGGGVSSVGALQALDQALGLGQGLLARLMALQERIGTL